MIIVEIYSKDELLWGGAMPAVPQLGAFIHIQQPPEVVMMADDHSAAQSMAAPPETKVYQITNVMYPVQAGYPIMQFAPRLQAIEIDLRTGRQKEPLVKTPEIIH